MSWLSGQDILTAVHKHVAKSTREILIITNNLQPYTNNN